MNIQFLSEIASFSPCLNMVRLSEANFKYMSKSSSRFFEMFSKLSLVTLNSCCKHFILESYPDVVVEMVFLVLFEAVGEGLRKLTLVSPCCHHRLTLVLVLRR